MNKIVNLLLIGIIAIGSLTGCGKPATDNGKAQEVSELTAYGVIDPQISAQQIIADKKGYFKDEGLNVKNQLVQSGGEISPLIAGNTAGISFESTYTDIALTANGVKVKILAPMANSGDTQCVVARKGLVINNAKELEGKKIGMASGAGVLIAIRNMCKELGVDIDKIEFVTLAPSDQIAAMEKGDIDLMACWEPWVGNAIEGGGTLLFSGLNAYLPEKQGGVEWLNFYTTVQATDEFLEKNPHTVEALLRALARATDFINNNREEAATIIAKEINIDEKQVLDIMAKNVYDMTYDSAFLSSTNEMASFMKEMNNITVIPEIDTYTASEPLKNAVPELVKEN